MIKIEAIRKCGFTNALKSPGQEASRGFSRSLDSWTRKPTFREISKTKHFLVEMSVQCTSGMTGSCLLHSLGHKYKLNSSHFIYIRLSLVKGSCSNFGSSQVLSTITISCIGQYSKLKYFLCLRKLLKGQQAFRWSYLKTNKTLIKLSPKFSNYQLRCL